ncbi:hypothetical protein GNX14_26800 [Mesorhizobium japonicum]|uniref:hypothetical protein n=1 Tax=Mesorhizobium TaxID=68287 RepID=UPI0012E13C44|nr:MULTISPECIES: hypothetical protein [Mesorhizobium]MUT24753.1 hypothetical protein [Mesorhizobium japonicum]
MSARIQADGGNLFHRSFPSLCGVQHDQARAFDAVSKGCSIPSTLMIFAVRVVLFWQHHGEQAAVVILDPGRIERGAYCREKGEVVWFRREAVDAPACPYVEIVHARP